MTNLAEQYNQVLLVVTGEIPTLKSQEFEKTYRLASGNFPTDCRQNWLARDTTNDARYIFFSAWNSQKSLDRFKESREYLLISGAFQALGNIQDMLEVIDIKSTHHTIKQKP